VVKEKTTSVQRPVLNSLHLHTMAGKAKIELIESKKPHAKQLEQPSKGGVGY
jgi:hypothetical protein